MNLLVIYIIGFCITWVLGYMFFGMHARNYVTEDCLIATLSAMMWVVSLPVILGSCVVGYLKGNY